jgi:ATP-dependent protease HslVU (ClpYQ) peptidase subunit
MHAVYDSLETAREIAEVGVAAGIEFDKNSAGPLQIYSIELQ